MANEGFGNAFVPRDGLKLFKDDSPPKVPCAVCRFARRNKRHQVGRQRMDSHAFVDPSLLISADEQETVVVVDDSPARAEGMTEGLQAELQLLGIIQ